MTNFYLGLIKSRRRRVRGHRGESQSRVVGFHKYSLDRTPVKSERMSNQQHRVGSSALSLHWKRPFERDGWVKTGWIILINDGRDIRNTVETHEQCDILSLRDHSDLRLPSLGPDWSKQNETSRSI